MVLKSRPRLSSRFIGAVAALAFVQLAACSTPEERAQRYLVSGQELLAMGDVAKARLEFRNALTHKKDLVAAWRGLAEIEEKQRNWEALGPNLRAVLEYDPADLGARLKLVRLMLLAGVPHEALPLISPASDAESATPAAVALKAAVLLGLGDSAGALQEAQRALAIEPHNPDAILILAGQKLRQGDPEQALEALIKAPMRPDLAIPVGVLRIQIFEKLGATAKVERELRELVDLNPRAFRPELLRFLLASGRDLDAETELRAAAATNDSDVGAILDLVRFLNARRGSAVAQRELEDRIRKGGDIFPFQLALAELQIAAGRLDPAIQSLETLVLQPLPTEQKIKAQLSLASIYLKRSDSAAAEAKIAYVLQEDSRNVDGLRLRAGLQIEQGRLDHAIADLREALKEQPNSAPLLRMMAVALERAGSIELAEKNYADATRASQFDPATGLQYVAFLQRRSSPARVDQVLTELASRHPGNVEIWTALGQAKLQTRDWAGAQHVAETIRRLGNQRGIADQIIGMALIGQNRLNESIQALQAAFQANAASVQPLTALVRAYLRAQKFDDAETLLRGILKASPGNAEALVLLGSVQLAKNLSDEALISFQTAIERQPRAAIGHNALVDFHVRQKDHDRALAAVQNGLKELPDHANLRFAKASILEAKRDFDGAIAEYETMLARDPSSLVAANNLASLLSEHRTDKASLSRAQDLAALLRKSNVPQFKDTLGWINYLSGDHRTAVVLLEEAATALPHQAQVRYHLGMVYRKTGQLDKSQEQLEKASELEPGEGMLKDKIRAALRGS